MRTFGLSLGRFAAREAARFEMENPHFPRSNKIQ